MNLLSYVKDFNSTGNNRTLFEQPFFFVFTVWSKVLYLSIQTAIVGKKKLSLFISWKFTSKKGCVWGGAGELFLT